MDRSQCNRLERKWSGLLARRGPATVWPWPRLVEFVCMGSVRGPEATSLGRYMGWIVPIPEWQVSEDECGRGGPRGSLGHPSGPRRPAVGGDPGWISELG